MRVVILFKVFITEGRLSVTIFVWPAFMNKYFLLAGFLVAFVAGWQVQDWRMGGQIAEANSRTAETLKSIAVAAADKQRELAVSGCASTQVAQPVAIDCPKPDPVPAWIMEAPPNLMQMLDSIIIPSETESSE